MGNLAELLDTPLESGEVVDVGVPLFPWLVAGDDEGGRPHVDEPALGLDLERVSVQKSQEGVVLEPTVELVEDDGELSVVAVPPLGAVAVGPGHDEGVRGLHDGLHGLARARGSPVDLDRDPLVGVPLLSDDELGLLDSAVELHVDVGDRIEDLLLVRAILDHVVRPLKVVPVPIHIHFQLWLK